MTDLRTEEPLARLADLAEYRQGLERYQAGEWDDERFTAHRVRFGVYGQRQPGVQMVRIKLPGGIVPVAWLKTLGRINHTYAQGDAHFTTRQDLQIYHVPLADTPALLSDLYSNGITTREACGNTLRNMTACALAGACPRERVDAGAVAAQLARAWIRHPLVQHMPRKFKITVSGCGTDCGASAIHDIGLVADERDGVPGFRVLAGGGLGGAPLAAVPVLDFVEEADLPAVVEAGVRLHQRYSDRRNRNAARLKFVHKRFGAERFIALFREEFERVRGLPQRPFPGFAWRKPAAAANDADIARMPVGVLDSHDGTKGIVAYVPLGIVSSEQLKALADIAEAAGIEGVRVTRDQNVALLGLAPEKVAEVSAKLASIGFAVPKAASEVPSVISCPGTTTCRIGITNSQSFARAVEAEAKGNDTLRPVSVHVSGCQNSCGLHHVADIGLHGMAKKIDGRVAPHYQMHLGGDGRVGDIGLSGPMVPARLANRAIDLVSAGFTAGRQQGESVRAWAQRLGKDGLAQLLAPLDGADADGLFVDWGEAADFAGAPQTRGECAAPFAGFDRWTDLADDALINLDRFALAGRLDEALVWAERALATAALALASNRGTQLDEETPLAVLQATLLGLGVDGPELAATFQAAVDARSGVTGPDGLEAAREAVALFLDTARAAAEAPAIPAEAAVGDLAAILGAAE